MAVVGSGAAHESLGTKHGFSSVMISDRKGAHCWETLPGKLLQENCTIVREARAAFQRLAGAASLVAMLTWRSELGCVSLKSGRHSCETRSWGQDRIPEGAVAYNFGSPSRAKLS